uniref:Minor capsid protein L2 n=1 Tax=human papillomavirus 81 TaxID=333771 RepID=A0A7U3NUJ6_9PAPI|nr:L2 [human papillomavirus 81]
MPKVLHRRKRASVTDLYRSCKVSGTCPSDVVPKVEGNTLADKILKWASLGVFFGGLGIGTASGSGGRTGYIPIGGRPPSVVDIGPVSRPPVVIDSVGAADPSIVTLVEESSVIEAGATHPNFTGTSGFEITTSSTTTPAVLDITPTGTTVQVSSTNFLNPLYTEPSIIDPPQTGEITGHVFTSTPTAGSHSYEEIPMVTFASNTGTGGEPISSTPMPGVRRLAGPRLRLYTKATQQVPVRDPAFVSHPASFATFDNPVYDPEETIIFEHPSIYQPPDPDFLDIVQLHRPALTARQGTVRVSRIGQRASLRTRSGKHIGARVHFYHDISPIPTEADIELQPLLPPSSVSSTDALYDVYADDQHLDAVLQSVPSLSSRSSVSGSATLSATSVASSYNTTVPLSSGFTIPASTGPDVELPYAPLAPSIVPSFPATTPYAIYVVGTDFYLFPSYIFFPKKHKRIHYSFTDGYVAAW